MESFDRPPQVRIRTGPSENGVSDPGECFEYSFQNSDRPGWAMAPRGFLQRFPHPLKLITFCTYEPITFFEHICILYLWANHCFVERTAFCAAAKSRLFGRDAFRRALRLYSPANHQFWLGRTGRLGLCHGWLSRSSPRLQRFGAVKRFLPSQLKKYIACRDVAQSNGYAKLSARIMGRKGHSDGWIGGPKQPRGTDDLGVTSFGPVV